MLRVICSFWNTGFPSWLITCRNWWLEFIVCRGSEIKNDVDWASWISPRRLFLQETGFENKGLVFIKSPSRPSVSLTSIKSGSSVKNIMKEMFQQISMLTLEGLKLFSRLLHELFCIYVPVIEYTRAISCCWPLIERVFVTEVNLRWAEIITIKYSIFHTNFKHQFNSRLTRTMTSCPLGKYHQ